MKIVSNGLHALNLRAHSSSMVYVSGVLGGATANIVKKTGFTLTESPLEINKAYEVKHGSGVGLFVEVSGAGGTTSIELDVHGLD